METKYTNRFWEKVKKTQTCWLWVGTINDKGYGIFEYVQNGDRNRFRAHRISYQLSGNKIPDSLVLDHLCRVRNCVNPQHLQPVTLSENIYRGEGIAAGYLRRTHCIRGHELSGRNVTLYVEKRRKNGKPVRRCHKCDVIRNLSYRKKYGRWKPK